jgi:Zn-dependent metalloprotease
MLKKSPFALILIMLFGQMLMAQLIPGKYSSIPQYLPFGKTAVPVSEFGLYMAQHYKLPAGNGFKLLTQETDQLGMVHYRYQQTVNGVPVEGTMYIVHTRNGLIQSANGELMDAISPATPALNGATAINKALAYTGASEYKWQSEAAEKALKENTGNAAATYYPQADLVYVAEGNKLKNGRFKLAYKIDVYAAKPLSRNYVFIDAATGAVIATQNRIEHVDATATAHTQYEGTQTITTDSYNGAYRLREAARGNGIRTYNAQQSTNPANTDFTNATTDWNNVNTAKDEYATDAHFASEMTYDFYKNLFNRNSLDNNGLILAAYVHYDVDLDNAFWDGGSMNYGDGSTTNNTTPYTTLDIGGHEITHGLTQYTANLDYQDESGALNESFSDCMGVSIRQFVRQSATVEYRIGVDNGPAFRSMRTPKTYGQPDTYLGQYWYTGTADNGGVHTNSGVQNHWFYIVANGEAGTNDNNDAYNVPGISIEKAQAITYRSLAFYLTQTSGYAEARTYSIKAAEDLYGVCSPEVITVTNAWFAVGVGARFTATVTSDFNAPVTSACSVPANISFTDASTNAIYYVWDFGDGTTSNQQNPSHTYTTYGTYSVKLMSWSPDCGYDSVTKVQLITLTDNTPAVSDVTICPGTNTTLSATGSGNIQWYDASVAGNQLANTSTFSTPALSQSTIYYVQNSIPGPAGVAGPAVQTFGSGGYNNFAHYMVFDNTVPQTLVSVLVDANSAGNRTIELRNSSNAVLATTTVNLTTGTQTVPLNFALPAQTNLQLGIYTGTYALYRNSSGATYPYTSTDGSLTITNNDVGDLDRYYFFYNWQLQQPACVSNRVPVTVNVLGPGCVNGIDEATAMGSIALMPNPANNVLNVKLNAQRADNNGKLLIQNILGETLMTQTTAISGGSNSWSLDLSAYAPGVYLLTLLSDKTTVTKRFVKGN